MIPIIDLKDQHSKIVQNIHDAYTQIGFAVFANAFNSDTSADFSRWFDCAKAFFDLDLEIKQKYPHSGTSSNKGYVAMQQENVDPKAPGDLKEAFNWAKEKYMPPELWPQEVEGFAPLAKAVNAHADALTLRLLHFFELALEVPAGSLVECHRDAYSTSRFIHYPAYNGPIQEGQLRIGEHTDFGSLTLLWQVNPVSGLEVKDKQGNWHAVPDTKEGIIVNIGDLMQRWTNDYFVSTPHRVVNTEMDKPRYSMPHFVDPTPGTLVQNLRKEPAKYVPIISEEYLKQRLAQSY